MFAYEIQKRQARLYLSSPFYAVHCQRDRLVHSLFELLNRKSKTCPELRRSIKNQKFLSFSPPARTLLWRPVLPKSRQSRVCTLPIHADRLWDRIPAMRSFLLQRPIPVLSVVPLDFLRLFGRARESRPHTRARRVRAE